MPRAGRTSPLTRSRPASRARLLRRATYPRQFGGVGHSLYRLGGQRGYAHERTDGDCDGDAAAGAVVGTDAVLYTGSLAAGRTQIHGMAGPVHRGRTLLYAAAKECAAPRVAPRSDTVGRPGAVRGR